MQVVALSRLWPCLKVLHEHKRAVPGASLLAQTALEVDISHHCTHASQSSSLEKSRFDAPREFDVPTVLLRRIEYDAPTQSIARCKKCIHKMGGGGG